MKKQFNLGQKVLWITRNDEFPENKAVVKAVIVQIKNDHCVARSCENNNNTDNMNLWIDENNEMEFFDTDIMEKLFLT